MNKTITALKVQARDASRVNVFIDGAYRFSLDMAQIVSLGVRTGQQYTEEQLLALEDESRFGKLYARALEYVLMRPRSRREILDYLYRKTKDTRSRNGSLRKGYSKELTERVFQRLQEKSYIDDEKFARFWVENRNLRKGSSFRKLRAELAAKGVQPSLIEAALQASGRLEADDLQKIIAKKYKAYPEEQKLIGYLARQGFSYDDIKAGLQEFYEINGVNANLD